MSMGGGSDSANREIIELQKEEAAKREAKEAERQARLARGRNMISAIFEGGTVEPPSSWGGGMSDFVNPEWTSWNEAQQAAREAPPDIPERPYFNTTTDAGQEAAREWDARYGRNSHNGRNSGGIARRSDGGGDGGFAPTVARAIFGLLPDNPGGPPEPNRYLTNQQAFDAGLISPEEAGVQRYSGIGQNFYDSFRSSLDDFYYPELERQYGDAKSQSLFDLARKGLLRSSEAADRAGELARDYSENRAQIGSNIESQISGLQDSVNRSRRNALNLLTSTEDPTSAANQALTEVNAVRTQKPQFNALGDLFANVLNTFGIARQAARQREYLDQIPTRGAYESSGSYYG